MKRFVGPARGVHSKTGSVLRGNQHSVSPGKMGGHRQRVLEPHRAFIVERINQTSHLTLHGLKDELAARGVKVSHDTVWKFLRREGLRFKKRMARPSASGLKAADQSAPTYPVSRRTLAKMELRTP